MFPQEAMKLVLGMDSSGLVQLLRSEYHYFTGTRAIKEHSDLTWLIVNGVTSVESHVLTYMCRLT